ncbi:MAG: ImmA/IrrE family metallo-endopeptidase [Eubacteriales bacterium]
MNDIFVRLAGFPATVKGVTVVDDNGDYNIFINQNMAQSQQKLTLCHELTHIRRNDFDSLDDIDELEKNMP